MFEGYLEMTSSISLDKNAILMILSISPQSGANFGDHEVILMISSRSHQLGGNSGDHEHITSTMR